VRILFAIDLRTSFRNFFAVPGILLIAFLACTDGHIFHHITFGIAAAFFIGTITDAGVIDTAAAGF
jgi:hypothetical protein